MTGPEHYRAAEILLANLRDEMAGSPGTPLRTKEQQAQMIAEAQVHATLALAAATAEPWLYEINERAGDYANHEWLRALS